MLQNPFVLVSIAAASVGGLALIVWLCLRRITPEERERRRRLWVNRRLRTWEGFVTDANEETIQYTYDVQGAEYFASQDIRTLRALLPRDPAWIIGPVSVKYEPSNPANSIVICEGWSGLKYSNEETAEGN